MAITLKSQSLSIEFKKPCDFNSLDTTLNKKTWQENLFSYDKSLFAEFDSNGNLKVFGNLFKKKKAGKWYYFTNNVCDSICMFDKDKRSGKSYYFNNGEISLITYTWNNKNIEICYNPAISKEHYLTESFVSDCCIQEGVSYYCNGIKKYYFPFSNAVQKIEDLCFTIGGISRPDYSNEP